MKRKRIVTVGLSQAEYSEIKALAEADHRNVGGYVRAELIKGGFLRGCTHTRKAGSGTCKM